MCILCLNLPLPETFTIFYWRLYRVFTPYRAEQPLQGMELKKKRHKNIKAHRKSLLKEPTINRCRLILQSVTKYLRLTLVFVWKSAPREKFNRYFSRLFLVVLTKFLFWQGGWELGHYSIRFTHFPNIS